MQRKRRPGAGRKGYPDRAAKRLAYRPHVEVEQALKAKAEEVGMSWSETTSWLVAKALDMEEYGPTPEPQKKTLTVTRS